MNGHTIISAPVRTPWDSLGSILGFENEDQEFWWKATAPVLGKFLIKADYDVHQHYTCFLSSIAS
jgi:hypothetical protein